MGPLEFLYYTGYKLKKSRDLKSRKRLPAKVISVGNITVGGTGKTPAVIAIARKAKEYGYLPCILTRGYRGSAKGPCFVSRGEGPLLGVDEAGDEPVLMAERLTGVPIVKGSDRYEAGMFALDCLDSPSLLFILDDGFQHRALHRDVDVLLIDGMNPVPSQGSDFHQIPAGDDFGVYADLTILIGACEFQPNREEVEARGEPIVGGRASPISPYIPVIRGIRLTKCWPVSYQVSDLEALSSEIAIESLSVAFDDLDVDVDPRQLLGR